MEGPKPKQHRTFFLNEAPIRAELGLRPFPNNKEVSTRIRIGKAPAPLVTLTIDIANIALMIAIVNFTPA